jgi:biopolymer transport protein ExbD
MSAGPMATGGGGRRGQAVQTVAVLNLLTDLAFNLLIFFVVVASNETEQKGRPQQVPSANKDKAEQPKSQNVEIAMTRTTASVNGAEVSLDKLTAELTKLLAGKARPDDRIVVVHSAKDVPYSFWIQVTGKIDKAGGVITLQLDEEKQVVVP